MAQSLPFANQSFSALVSTFPTLSVICLVSLFNARGFLRKRLASKLRLRNTPQLRFHYDRSVDEGTRMDRLIEAARRRDSHE